MFRFKRKYPIYVTEITPPTAAFPWERRRHTGEVIKAHWPPNPGDLMRSDATPGYCNVVLDCSEIKEDRHGVFVLVRSVRYANVGRGYLNGRRSRLFKLYSPDSEGEFKHRASWEYVTLQSIGADAVKNARALIKQLSGCIDSFENGVDSNHSFINTISHLRQQFRRNVDIDDSMRIARIVDELKDVDTSWKPPAEGVSNEEIQESS